MIPAKVQTVVTGSPAYDFDVHDAWKVAQPVLYLCAVAAIDAAVTAIPAMETHTTLGVLLSTCIVAALHAAKRYLTDTQKEVVVAK